jgi:TolB-like protein
MNANGKVVSESDIGSPRADDGPDCQVREAACGAALQRVLSSVTFVRAEQLRRLLNFLAVRSLSGADPQISERDIAEYALNRRNFEPQADSLVRKEMSRLRDKLTRYYLTEGARDEIRIGAPDGYLLTFSTPPAVEASRKPCWLILPFRCIPDLADQAEQVLDEICMYVHQNGAVELVAPSTALAYRGRSGDARAFAKECTADYLVEGSLRRRDENIETMVWVVEGGTGRCTLSSRISSPDAGELARIAGSWMLEGSQLVNANGPASVTCL